MDHAYLCRPGKNEELRYSLRSLDAHVPHDRVWIVGEWPNWVTGVVQVPRPLLGSPQATTTDHLRHACRHEEISDPFVLWHDDMYAVEPTDVIVLHNGRIRPKQAHTRWFQGQRATYRWLRDNGFEKPLSYELHVPLIVHKEAMLEALGRLGEIRSTAPHKRTVYGNLAGLGGEYSPDVKVMNPRATVEGPWLSSADATFKSCVLPRLPFTEPGRFER